MEDEIGGKKGMWIRKKRKVGRVRVWRGWDEGGLFCMVVMD
jgi:hypothetical protein